ncbi:MAG: hypothetical protein ACJAS1_005916 [Oleiphilaceae bacterium]|jgi:hypothetical protein
MESSSMNLGKLGERKFDTWCIELGLVTNSSSEEDAYGWDYLVEFPSGEDLFVTKDKEKSPIECKVQVKSTQGNDTSLGLKLSVLDRLIKYPLPAFILFIKFNKSNQQTETVHLVHIDKKIISNVLKRLRKNDLLDSPSVLNKLFMRIKYDDSNEIEIDTTPNIKKAIEQYVPNGLNQYTNDKLELLKILGYEQAGYRLTFSTSKADKDMLIDMSLGIIDSIDITKSSLLDNRFNMLDRKNPIHHNESAKLCIGNANIKRCELRFKESKFSPAIIFNSEVIPLPFNAVLNDDEKILSFKTKLFSIVLSGSQFSFESLKFTLDNKATVSEVISFLTLFSSENSSRELILQVYFIDDNKTISFSANISSGLDIKPELGTALKSICHAFQIKSDYLINLPFLMSVQDSIISLNALIKNKIGYGEIQFNPQKEFETPKEVVFIKGCYLDFHDFIVGGVFALYSTKSETENNRYKVVNSELLKPVLSYEQISQEDFSNLLEEATTKLEQQDSDNLYIKLTDSP